MFLLPISVLLIITIITSWGKSVLSGVFSKKIPMDNGYNVWFFSLWQSVFCALMIALIFILSESTMEMSTFTIITGILMGCANIFALIANMKAYSVGPFSYTTVIISLSTVVTALSGLFFGEEISVTQYIGIALMVICLILSPDKKGDSENKRASSKWLILTLIATFFGGATGIIQKAHQNSVYNEEMPALLLSCFGISIIVSAIMLWCQKDKPEHEQNSKAMLWLLPVTTGIMFAFPHTINLYLAGKLDSVIMFPMVNLCPMILSMVTGIIIFKERLSAARWCGVAIGIVATVLVSGIF